MGVAGLLPLLEPYMERIDPSAGLDGGLRCVVDASAFIHQLLKRHAPQIMLSDSWLGFDKDVRVLLRRLKRNSKGGTLGVVFYAEDTA